MAQSYRFGPAELRPAERQLLVEGRQAHIGGRAFDVLVALVDRRDRVVTKDELFELAWPGLVVEENNLHVQISALRKILGAQSVSTVAGRGFRFMAEVEVVDGPSMPVTPRNHNLPAQLNSFVGRAAEIARVKELLGSARLVTLTGMGGTGKSRLSLQFGHDVAGNYPDGVWLVELAPIADPNRVSQAVAFALDVKEVAGRPVIEALLRHVRDRNLLIILDNCEHLLQASAEIAKHLLQSGPGVHILASSREALRITGETTYPVPALAVPAAREALAAEALAKYDSVRLFSDRAGATRPGFTLDNGNGKAVATICRQLDGIPLAIELAAAHVGSLSVDQISARLSDSLRVLTGGDRTNPSRQQTLRACIDWSHDLLSIPEREIFCRLAVFAGGWSVEAAEAVCSGGEVQERDVLELLTHLVEKSLVAADAQGERFRLLETVRQYGQELLHASGEEDGVRSRHLAFYVELTEPARKGLTGPARNAWLSRLDQEGENILSAHAWCDHEPNGGELGLKLSRATKGYWINRGLLALGHRMAAEALARLPASQRDAVRCRGLFDAGQLAFFMGRYGESRRHLEESLAIARELGDQARIAAALQPLGMACLGEGDIAVARTYLEEGLELARGLGNKRDLLAAMNALAQLHRVEGSLDAAERLYDDTLSISVELGDAEGRAVALLNLAMVAILRGTPARARGMIAEAIEISQSAGMQRVTISALEVCAGLSASSGDFEKAARFFGVAEAQNNSAGLHRDAADDAFLAPLMEKARDALGKGYRAGEDSGRALAYGQAVSEARTWLATA